MAAKMGVLGLLLSFYPYLRSAMVRFPLQLDRVHNRINFKTGFTKKLLLPEECGRREKIYLSDSKKKDF